MRRILIVCILFALCIAFLNGSSTESELVSRFIVKQATPFFEARTLRHLEAGRPGQPATASMDAETSFSSGNFEYRIVRESGSGTVRNKVFRELLEGEAKESRKGSFSRSLFSEENYAFLSPEQSSGIWKMRINPKRTGDFLISGYLSLSGEGSLFASEGRLVKNPSFWVKEVNVSVEYSDFDGLDLPTSFNSEAKVRFLGQYVLKVSYIYLSVNGRHVSQDR